MTLRLGPRIGFTIGALLVYRLGTQIPLLGIDLHVWEAIFQRDPYGVLGMSNLLSGGSVRHLALFALGVTPYVSAAILLQLASIYFSGISLLVAVCVTLDIKAQFQGAALNTLGGERS
jgi:preprotein translocase subunit SecY